MNCFSYCRTIALVALMTGQSMLHAADEKDISYQRLDGQTMTGSKTDAVVKRLMQEAHVTGLALAVFNHNDLAYLQTYGLRDKDRRLPFEIHTVTYGASLTKAVFATLLMQLVDEGKVDLDRSIAEYLPKPLPAYEKYADLAGDERWKKFTLRILLDHTSGMPNFRFVNANGKLDIKFEPGTRYSYCGEGINLAQFVLEEGLGWKVGDLLRDRFFVPLGMNRTSLTWRDDFAANVANGHDEQEKGLGHKQRGSVRAAGSMDTTIGDYSKFIAALMQGKLLSKKAMAEVTRAQVEIFSEYQFPVAAGPVAPRDTDENRKVGLSYGLGWGVLQHTPYGKAYFKEGHDDGWGNYAIVFGEAGTAIVLLSNSSNGERIFKALLEELIGDTFTPWKWERYTPYEAPTSETK